MNRPILSCFLSTLLAVTLTFGCASQKDSARTDAPTLTPPPEQVANTSGDATAPQANETDEWQEDDIADWDEDEPDEFEDATYTVADPIEPFNRVMFAFNDKLYSWVLRPIALGYRKVAPVPVRTGVQNFFHNLTTPIRFVNCLLQGKGQAAAAEFSNFTINSIFGVLGFGNLTKDYPELNPDSEDLGQTLGTYGIGDGFYIVWPFIGTTTLRDTTGRLGDAVLDPVNYITPTEASIATRGFNTVNRLSFRIEDIDDGKRAAFDPYQAARDFYIQSRQTRIKR